jgi:hypothetical protein
MKNNNASSYAFALMILLMICGFWYLVYQRDTLINECEKNLPRTQHCHLIAIPNE